MPAAEKVFCARPKCTSPFVAAVGKVDGLEDRIVVDSIA
jgi:hypothetical protein